MRVSARHYSGERFYASSFTEPTALTTGDVTAGEDPVVRAAALAALGNMNGTALAIDPSTEACAFERCGALLNDQAYGSACGS